MSTKNKSQTDTNALTSRTCCVQEGAEGDQVQSDVGEAGSAGQRRGRGDNAQVRDRFEGEEDGAGWVRSKGN